MAPPLILVSLLLWYPFAVQTHEGFSTGSAISRSHNYYGHFMYWFSLGLSMHRVHRLQPKLSWLELRPYVERLRRDCHVGCRKETFKFNDDAVAGWCRVLRARQRALTAGLHVCLHLNDAPELDRLRGSEKRDESVSDEWLLY